MEPGLVLSEMQEMHPIAGGRFFGASGTGGDRRLRTHNTDHQNHQPLKCPRCDSLNTKFCYYNNYNLSQPRHFCKSCRRYWTKGGVLRNVPVGGGCRKAERPKPKKCSSETSSAAATTAPPPSRSEREHKTTNSHSSSENSGLTAVAAAVTTEAVSDPSSNSTSNNLFDNIQDSNLVGHSNSKPSSGAGVAEEGGESGIFSEIENLTSLVTPTNDTLAFGYGNMTEASSFQLCSEWEKGTGTSDGGHEDLKWGTGSLMEQRGAVENKIGDGGGGPLTLDWEGSGDDEGLFGAGNNVEEGLWSHNQWNEENSSLFHLP